MREISKNSGSGSSFWTWKSPLPYLFGSLGLMLLLIVVALIVLACSFHKRLSSSDQQIKSSCPPVNSTVVEMSPRIVVIMAGDQKPTHIGVPISSDKTHTAVWFCTNIIYSVVYLVVFANPRGGSFCKFSEYVKQRRLRNIDQSGVPFWHYHFQLIILVLCYI